MNGEYVFRVNGAEAVRAEAITLAQAGLRERDHLQEWVIANPDVLGEDVVIVDTEFDRWFDHRGARERDRLDILALDAEGRLVVVELKRDRAPDTVEMQALKYAALVSRFTREDLGEVHARFLSKSDDELVDADEALARLEAVAPITEESLRLPRVVLMASDFPKTVTATVVFLHQQLDLDIRLLKFQAYRSDEGILLTVSQHYPPPGIEEFVLTPSAAEARQKRTATATREREASAVKRLLAEGVLTPGEQLAFRPPSEDAAEVEAWFDADTRRRTAAWQEHPVRPLVWDADGQEYSPTGLTQIILEQAADRTGAIQGPKYWLNADGKSLVELAAELSAVPIEHHLRRLTDDLRPVYDALEAAIHDSFDTAVVTSQARAIRYDVQGRKLADLLIHRDHLSLYIRGLPTGQPDPMSLVVNSGANPTHAQLRRVQDVAGALELLRAQVANRTDRG